MATFVLNTPTSNPSINALISATRWSSGTITYNFPLAGNYYAADYLSTAGSLAWDIPGTFEAVGAGVQAAFRIALDTQFAAVANLTFQEVSATAPQNFTSLSGSQATGADLSIGRADISPTGNRALAFLPGDLIQSGDVWIDISRGNPSQAEGIVPRYVLHELGHALGLKHGHETGQTFLPGVVPVALPANLDTNEFTLMTYRRYVGGPTEGDLGVDTERGSEPQSLMMLDIQALQYMYGANFNWNASNTIYTFSATTGEMFINGVGQGVPQANKIYRTIWDGNGVDTYDLGNYTTSLNIDLAPGGWSVFANQQLALISIANNIHARGNVFNALQFEGDARSLIENAIGGSGNDILRGNAGSDLLDGGAGGVDTAVLSGNRADYRIVFSATSQTLSLTDLRAGSPDGTDSLRSIDFVQFADGTATFAELQTEAVTNSDPTIAATPAIDGNVAEGGTLAAAGVLTATDPDPGSTLRWSIEGGVLSGGANFAYGLDRLAITRNGDAAFFVDEFGNGTPGTADNTNNNNGYALTGAPTESGGRLILDNTGAVVLDGVGTTDPIIGEHAFLRTNIASETPGAGLRLDDAFTVEAKFDLVALDSPRERYALRLSDQLNNAAGTTPAQPGNDIVDLGVRMGNGGIVRVQLRELDRVADTNTLLQQLPLNAPDGATQIVLRLSHAANSGVATAAFDFLDAGGAVIGSQTFTQTATIFSGEDWTRVQVIGLAPEITDSTLAGTYGTLNVNQSGAWSYTLADGLPTVQALAAGQTVLDVFTAVVSDGAGGTDTETITIQVTGENDAPTLTTPILDQSVEEGAGFVFTLPVGTFADIDATDVLTLSVAGAPAWLTFDSATRTFSGTPGLADAGVSTITVTATDPSGAQVTDQFVLSVIDMTQVGVFGGSVVEGNDGTRQLRFTVERTDNTRNFIVDYTTANGSATAGLDYDLAFGTLSFTAGGALSQDILVTVRGDVEVESDETVFLNLTAIADISGNARIDLGQGIGTIVNDDAPNQNPVATGDSATTNEDQSVLISVLANDSDPDAGQTASIVSFGQGASGGVTQEGGQLRYTPGPNFFGTDSFTYTVSDGNGGSDSATVSVTINSVNDRPTFVILANPPAVNEDAGAQTVAGLVSAINVGPTNEAGQTVSFSIGGNSNPSLFAVAPVIGSNGTLTYTPAANASGTALITVTAQDTGGTANGGVATSLPTQFLITVDPVNDAAVIGGTTTGTVDEDSVPNTATGTLTVTDIDSAATFQAVTGGPTANGFGTFSINAAGAWSYALDNGNTNVNALNDGDTLGDSFTVTTADGTQRVVSITITGTTDVVANLPRWRMRTGRMRRPRTRHWSSRKPTACSMATPIRRAGRLRRRSSRRRRTGH